MEGFIYIIKWWVAFPASEYGGLVVITAKDDDEAVQFLLDRSQERERDNHLGYGADEQENLLKIPLAVKSARKLRLHSQETGLPPEVVGKLIT